MGVSSCCLERKKDERDIEAASSLCVGYSDAKNKQEGEG